MLRLIYLIVMLVVLAVAVWLFIGWYGAILDQAAEPPPAPAVEE